MSIRVKSAAAWRTVTQPWVKVGGAWRPTVKVFNKVDGNWVESWPLQPGPCSNAVITTVYRNDRIEIDVDWDGPTTGEVAAKYIVTVHSPGVYITTVEVGAPTTALTLTNGGNGFHTIAGYGVFAQVYAVSAAGRTGDMIQSPTTTIAQLPAPDPPTSYSVSMWQCSLHHSWSHPGGRRIDGIEIHVYHGGAGAAGSWPWWYGASDFQGWNPATIGAGTVTCYCRSYGPGGASNWVVVQGEMPGAISTASYRFGDGYQRAAVNGINQHVQVHTLPYGGGYSHVATFGAGTGEVYDPNSVNHPRDRSWYGMLLRPVNPNNGWVGRDVWLGWVMKIPNPHYIGPVDSRTWGGAFWRAPEGQDWQGSSKQYNNMAFFFYGNQFYDYLSNAAVGYDIGITGALIALRREVSGVVGSVQPQLMVHRAGWMGEDDSIGGSVATNALARNQTAWVMFPADWAWLLKERWDGWKGIGLYHPNTHLLQGLNYVSLEYSIFTAWNYGTIDGGQFWLDTVCIFHSG